VRTCADHTVEAICQAHGITRQAFYQHRKRREKRRRRAEEVLQLVRAEREDHPRIGTRKLHRMHNERFRELGYGRDKLFDLLRQEDLLAKPPDRTVSTTDSKHRFRVYENLTSDYTPQQTGEVWVADLTYIETKEGFRYASILMDAYSRKIVGYHLSDRLTLEGPRQALKQALREEGETANGLIHHSDQGVQYCSGPYVSLLEDHDAKISMAAVGNPYENAKAERVIGTLKREYLLDGLFRSEAQAREALSEAVALYNRRRPHLALDYETPSAVHARSKAGETAVGETAVGETAVGETAVGETAVGESTAAGKSTLEKTRQPAGKLTNEEPNDKRGELALTP
jgi:putative transposase